MIARLAVCTLLACAAGCGSLKVSCEPETCQNGQAYKVCDEVDGDVEYEFGKQHCTCSITNVAACTTCETKLASYCGGTLDSMSCTAAFSGGVNGSDPTCAVSIAYDAASNQWTASTAGGLVPATNDTWTGFSMTVGGMPTVGTYTQGGSVSSLAGIASAGGATQSSWEASFQNGSSLGSATLSITILGPMAASSTGASYQPQGSWTGTLLDQTGGQSPVTMTVTF